MAEFDKQKVVDLLNRILEQELAGVVRYTHYSLLIFGYSRIPVVEWFRGQAHARGVRSADGVCRGDARRGGGQDDAQTRGNQCLATGLKGMVQCSKIGARRA